MSFLIYFFVLLVSAASVLFGLDLMSSPLPKTPNVPIGRSVQVASPAPAQQREKRAADERALTPVYPTEPGKPKVQAQAQAPQAQTSGAAPQEQAQVTPAPAAPAANVAQAPQSQPAPQMKAEAKPAAQPAPVATVAQAPGSQPQVEPVAAAQPHVTEAKAEPAAGEAKAEPVKVETAKVEPAKVEPAKADSAAELALTAQEATLHTSNSCNVQACGAAYQSFRAADCSYQPMSGPRRACTISGAATAAARAAKPREAAREVTGDDELRDVARVVKRQPLQLTPSARPRQSASNSEMSEVERIVRHMTRNENDDVAVQDGDGNVFIVRKGYR